MSNTLATAKTYFSCAETAQIVRAELKENFPGIKFSVKSKTYSGGSRINVSWTDGPQADAVKAITDRFEGADFDGMIDLKSYKDQTYHGKTVHFSADYIFMNREISNADEKIACAVALIEQECRVDGAGTSLARFGCQYVSDLARNVAYGWDTYGRKESFTKAFERIVCGW